ncbi:phasin family protein [Paucibacter sp. PLA-PC-4]|uniref:phasin family protein n=1 Tax=Paucibacter sp. PLA-PC-4 TaxID=2993655 RepID=UPI0022487A08|nr:phasin family protein [Paucibacter sp. PLA-PC-4]MCX2862532.1 phasin family protein [Paucibacter sp. PLA-PC-4]
MTHQANPFGDVKQMMEKFKMPGIDMSAIVEARRQDIEALTEANKAVFEAMQALAAKQAAMMAEAMQGMLGGSGISDPVKQTALMRETFETALADMKGLADTFRQAQAEAMAQIGQRAARPGAKT